MSFFRIKIYLKFKYFILSFFLKQNSNKAKIIKKLNELTKKKSSILTSQLRVGFFLVLKYLKIKNPEKKEIILNSYNLAEMANICENLKLKIIYTKLNKNIFISEMDLIKKINQNTLAVVATNIFNTSKNLEKIKKICKRKKISFIEDNAIYLDNFIKKKNNKIYSGSFGDYSLHSFNIMKNISAMYGGAVSTNDTKFIIYAKKELNKFKKFPFVKYFKQCSIYLILKVLSFNIFYNLFYLKLIRLAHKKNNKFILSFIYPSLKFKKKFVPKNYSSEINSLSVNMILLQLKDKKNRNLNHNKRKENNSYYNHLFKKNNIKNLKIIDITEPDFQNFNDFPIIVNNKNLLINYLLKKGIETKAVQYVDCHKIFKNQKKEKLESYENKILCLPNHSKITKKYIDFIVNSISLFYSNSKIN